VGAGSASGNPSRSLAPSQRAPPPPLPKERGGEAASLRSYCRYPIEEGAAWRRCAASTPKSQIRFCWSKAAEPTGNRVADLPLPPVGNGATQLHGAAGDRTSRRAG
jgi:hypothetical protein